MKRAEPILRARLTGNTGNTKNTGVSTGKRVSHVPWNFKSAWLGVLLAGRAHCAEPILRAKNVGLVGLVGLVGRLAHGCVCAMCPGVSKAHGCVFCWLAKHFVRSAWCGRRICIHNNHPHGIRLPHKPSESHLSVLATAMYNNQRRHAGNPPTVHPFYIFCLLSGKVIPD